MRSLVFGLWSLVFLVGCLHPPPCRDGSHWLDFEMGQWTRVDIEPVPGKDAVVDIWIENENMMQALRLEPGVYSFPKVNWRYKSCSVRLYENGVEEWWTIHDVGEQYTNIRGTITDRWPR